jgi:hypothetical protein
VEEVRAALEGAPPVAPPSSDDHAWWNSGELYDLEVASDGLVCTATRAAIPPGDICFVRPRQDYGALHRDVFALAYGIGTRDFDWKNFEERLRMAVQRREPASYREALSRAASATSGDAPVRLRALASALSASRVPVFGLDRKGGKKQDLRWDVFFAADVSTDTRAAAEAGLEGAEASWELGRVLTVHYADPAGTTPLKTFRDQIALRLDALRASTPIHAAHFCGAGNVRDSRAAVLEALGRAPYPFVFVNHGRASPVDASWSLLVRFPTAPAHTARATFDEGVVERSLRAEWSGRWATLTPIYSGAYGHWLEAKLEPFLESSGVDVVLLRGMALEGEGDGWHRWSEHQPGLPSEAELARLDAPRAEPDDAEMKRLVAEARSLYEADDAMDDPGSDVDKFTHILARIPDDRPEFQQVKEMLDQLLRMLAE